MTDKTQTQRERGLPDPQKMTEPQRADLLEALVAEPRLHSMLRAHFLYEDIAIGAPSKTYAEGRVDAFREAAHAFRYNPDVAVRLHEMANNAADELEPYDPSPEECERVVKELGIDIPEFAARIRAQIAAASAPPAAPREAPQRTGDLAVWRQGIVDAALLLEQRNFDFAATYLREMLVEPRDVSDRLKPVVARLRGALATPPVTDQRAPGEARRLLAELTKRIRWWAAQEDGIPEEAAPAYDAAMAYLFRLAVLPEAQRSAAEDYCDVCGGSELSTRPICTACEVDVAAVSAAGYAACQADVVAWLHGRFDVGGVLNANRMAEDIERGEHVGAAARKGGG